MLDFWQGMTRSGLVYQKTKIEELYLTYRKVANSRPVYYSIFDHFGGATNQDVLLFETCYYCYVQQSIKWWVHKRHQIFINLYLWKCICMKKIKYFTPLVFKNRASHDKYWMLDFRQGMARSGIVYQKTIIEELYLTYRKVANSRPVYYSIFDHFGGATNQDVLLFETCYYCYVQQSIKWWVHKRHQIFFNLYLWKCTCMKKMKYFTPIVFKNRASHDKWEYIHNMYHVIT